MSTEKRTLEECLRAGRLLLTEAALLERLTKEFHLEMDPFIRHARLLYEASEPLAQLYHQYIAVARHYNRPILLMTPTRRVQSETLRLSAYADRPVIAEACSFLKEIRAGYPDFEDQIYVGGLLGCKGDAFAAGDGLDAEAAHAYHRVQVQQFSQAGVDFLFAGIMPEIGEAVGMARAMADSGIPYLISFSIRKNGCLLDGTPIAGAIEVIDRSVDRSPVGYMVNCVHPVNLRSALENAANAHHPAMRRFLGIQANASSLDPETLNQQTELQQEDFDEMVEVMQALRQRYHLQILGGCCGTDHHFLEKLAASMQSEP
ncbi:MAG: homocysteine S-methyltransferase family protein [Marinilabiliales bacterium]|nr:homocysteine S-methyltransferase family protein [Marinilabiliales bacterium]